MELGKALKVTQSWIERGGAPHPALAAAFVVGATIAPAAASPQAPRLRARPPSRRRAVTALRQIATAARIVIPSTDIIATRDDAKLGLRAVAALERHATALEAASRPGRRVA